METKEEKEKQHQEALTRARQLLFNSFNDQYTSLSNTVRNLPIAPKLVEIILLEFDTGYLWVKEGLMAAELASNASVQPNDPVQPKKRGRKKKLNAKRRSA